MNSSACVCVNESHSTQSTVCVFMGMIMCMCICVCVCAAVMYVIIDRCQRQCRGGSHMVGVKECECNYQQ